MSEIFFIADCNRNILFMNKKGKDLFDYKDNSNYDFLLLFQDYLKPEIRNTIIDAFKNKLNSISPVKFKFPLKDSLSESLLQFEFISSPASVLHLYLITVDLKDKKSTEEKGNHQISAEFIENLPLGIYRTGVDGKVHYANQGMANIFGYHSLDEFYKINIENLYVEKHERIELIKSCFSGETQSFELKTYKKDNSIIWVKDSCRIAFDTEGKAVFLDGVMEDITSKKISDQMLLQSENQLKEEILCKDKFFSIISHDLRSPFNQIIGATELLLTKLDEYDKEMIRKFLSLLNKEAVQSYRLLENLLQWSKNQRGLTSYDPKPLNVLKLIKEIISVSEKVAENKRITIDVKITPDLHVYADKEMLLTILRNLLSNAIKFTDENGNITLSASKKMDYDLMQSNIEFCVSDDGIGIHENDIPKLFSLTGSYSAKGTYNETGTGLGLLLCKEFVEKHNGKIWVESEPGKGSNFKFYIP